MLLLIANDKRRCFMVDLLGILPVIGSAFVDWLQLFIAPLKNLDMLWIIVPVWGVWLFSEFFQEKKGTSFGNAITNGAVMLFVGVDWVRYIIRQISSGNASLSSGSVTELVVSVAIILVSITIILLGIRGNRIVKLLGRARESMYLLLMFTPIVYGVVEFTFRNLLLIMAFFPVFYAVIELLDRVLPTPRTYELEEEGKGLGMDAGLGQLGSDFGPDVFGSQQPPQQQWQRQPYPAYPGRFQQFNPQQQQRKP